MSLNDLTLGAYRPGDSPLHRLDPRLKLLGFPLLVVAAFSATGPARPVLLAALALLLLPLGKIPLGCWWRSVRLLRWLLLFTILVHLFFASGRTVAGVAWLSLDGLQRGMMVAGQLVLAVTFSSLLTLTTSPRELAGAFSSLLSPWRRWFPVREATLQFLLVVQFIPVLREEASAQVAASRLAGQDPGAGGLAARIATLGRMVSPLLLRLVDRADGLAQAAAAGVDVWGEKELPVLRARPTDRWVLLGGSIGLVLLFAGVP
ncbi:MAG: energy-coupling factor transporter transmembrane protein EcfT [Desulfuromonadales bacterium]|nr:energy-coupling factor transporter transmembrane protein EcfT [Desulfuromonadales bacterium]